MFDEARKQKLMNLFAEGVELDPAARETFAKRACGDDAELLEELLGMLAVPSEEVAEFLADPVRPRPSASSDPAPLPVIPGYTDVALIAEGGMGLVYRARQTEPVRRVVAIKVIRPGMDSRQILARFDSERQALARMAHPHIAVVHDAGTDDKGRPYLAMEFVDGVPINAYCRRYDLGLEPTLEAFVKVCEAVDHAHRRGVLHRDLKPDNVLVVHTDDGPLPKVIDFGIAKALEGSLGDVSIHTRQGSMLGTPEYMSPEQFVGNVDAVDTRTDVYALGAMLYELLCGERPFESERLRSVGIAEVAAIVRNEAPPRPSTRLRQDASKAEGQLSTAPWSRHLHSDLDWVVMKALEKEPQRRYHTPRDLADDLRRFLRREPIEAGPPSGFYRMRKFALRYRIQLAVAGALVAMLTAGLFGTLWYLWESKGNEAQALANAREAEGTRLAAIAAGMVGDDPNLALLLALEAAERSDDFSVRETMLEAIPKHNLVGRFAHADYGSIGAEFVDERRLLSRGVDPVFWLTDIDSGRLVHRFVGHSDRIDDMAISLSGSRVATASRDRSARIWDLETGVCVGVVPHPDVVSQVFWSPDEQTVTTVCRDGVVRVFAAEDGTRLREFGDDLRRVTVPDHGRGLVAVDEGGATVLFDEDGVRSLVIPPEPNRDARGRAAEHPVGGVAFVDADSARIVRVERWRRGPPRVFVYAMDGTMLAGFDQADVVRVLGDQLLLSVFREPGDPPTLAKVSLATGQLVEEIAIDGVAHLLAVNDRGDRAIGVDPRQDVCIVDLAGCRIADYVAGESDKNWRNRAVAFHPDGERFALTGGELLIARFEPEYAPFDIPLEGRAQIASLSAFGEALVLVKHPEGASARWSLWSIDAKRKLRDLPIEGVDNLRLVRGDTHLQCARVLPDGHANASDCEISTFDLEGRLLTRVVLPAGGRPCVLRPEGDLCAFLGVGKDGVRTAYVFDARTGARRIDVEVERGWIAWGTGSESRYIVNQSGSQSGTDVIEVETAARIASIRGPVGAGHYGVAIDEQRARMIVVLGDLRARSYDLGNAGGDHTGEYTRIARSDNYLSGIVADGSLAWVQCANEVHLFDAVTCEPFATLKLGDGVAFTASRADSSELITVASDGRCQRWPLDVVGVARRLARGTLTRRERDLFEIGTSEQRTALEEEQLRANPTSRRLARLGESRLERGDLTGAIDAYQRCCESGPLAPMDLRRYLRLLELLARRIEASGKLAAGDRTMARAALREAARCGVTRQALEDLEGFDALVDHAELGQLLPR